jgi:methyl-accepting chemotaxis protein
VENDLKLVAGVGAIQRAIVNFSAAFRELGYDPRAQAQRIYMSENPHAAGSRQNLLKANDGSEYSDLHATYHGWFSSLATARDYYDVFLVDTNGNIVYSVFKESDFATNLLDGEFKSTQLARIFRDAMEIAPGAIVASSFERYAPSQYVPAAFIGTPIFSEGIAVGVLIAQLRLDPFNQIMRVSNNFGQGAETYLVNDISLMATASRFAENSILAQAADTESVKRALAGASGFHVSENYLGNLVLSAYRPFVWSGGRWAAVAELDAAELDDVIFGLGRLLLLIGIATVLVFTAIGWVLAARE